MGLPDRLCRRALGNDGDGASLAILFGVNFEHEYITYYGLKRHLVFDFIL